MHVKVLKEDVQVSGRDEQKCVLATLKMTKAYGINMDKSEQELQLSHLNWILKLLKNVCMYAGVALRSAQVLIQYLLKSWTYII